ncbi:hypothetical protein U1Q18_038545 [Sarracenia purpurea var. burkii]
MIISDNDRKSELEVNLKVQQETSDKNGGPKERQNDNNQQAVEQYALEQSRPESETNLVGVGLHVVHLFHLSVALQEWSALQQWSMICNKYKYFGV